MFRNYLKILYRHIVKQKAHSTINIFGLALGITSCILLISYIMYELSFDGFHKNANRVYRLAYSRVSEGQLTNTAGSPAPAAVALMNDYPEVISAVRFMKTIRRSFVYQDKSHLQDGVMYADQSFFDVFSFELIEGDRETALAVPWTMVITESTAKRYFGDESPVGKIVEWDNNFKYTVTGVLKDIPDNSHFRFNVLASFSTLIDFNAAIGEYWLSWTFNTYLLLEETTDYLEFEKKLARFNDRYLRPRMANEGGDIRAYLQPLRSIHLNSNIDLEMGTNSDIRILYLLGAIAAVILLTACFNFVSLTTANAIVRAKEIGLRKVFGADRKKLIMQFLAESAAIAVIALVISMMAAVLLLPEFNRLTGTSIEIDYLSDLSFTGYLVLSALLTGLLSGMYPAFYLSAFRPSDVIKNREGTGAGRSFIRSVLATGQFTISIILMIATIIVFRQQEHLHTKDLGFNKDNVVSVQIVNSDVRTSVEAFRNELIGINGVIDASVTSIVPGEIALFLRSSATYPEGFDREDVFLMEYFQVDYRFLPTMEIDVVDGRGFSREFATEAEQSIMINQTAAKMLGWENPVGKRIHVGGSVAAKYEDSAPFTIIGVFEDSHQRSLYDLIAPTFLMYLDTEAEGGNYFARKLVIRIDSEDSPIILNDIMKLWSDYFPHVPFHHTFLDESFDNLHKAETKLGRIFSGFAIIVLLIGCFGLFGLASFVTRRRTREIGIRKVLGSNVRSVLLLVWKEFLVLVLISNLIAWPTAWFAMSRWLQDYPYTTEIGLGIFLTAALLSLATAMMTIGYRTVKAALANPVDSLRYE